MHFNPVVSTHHGKCRRMKTLWGRRKKKSKKKLPLAAIEPPTFCPIVNLVSGRPHLVVTVAYFYNIKSSWYCIPSNFYPLVAEFAT